MEEKFRIVNLKMKTSCFKYYTGDDGVSICIYPPSDWNGLQFLALAPERQMFYAIKHGKITKEQYEKEYREKILSKLNPHEIYKMFKNNVLLCWEDSSEFCHRKIVASWLYEALGVTVDEWKPSDEKIMKKNSNPLF
jgi:hypothetical protein